jgi:hypothetical protein
MRRVFDEAGVVRRPFRVLVAPAAYLTVMTAALATARRER